MDRLRNAKHQETTSERGQALVLIALLMVGLMGVMGLVVDGGNAYAQRRRMQNAADASALAGARQVNQMGATNGQILAKVNDYATRNGTSGNPPSNYVDKNGNSMGAISSYASGSPMPSGAVGVSVIATEAVSSYFLGVLGINAFPVKANAVGMAGPAGNTHDLVPWSLNWDAAGAALGSPVILGSSVGGGGTYNYESIDTVAEGLGPYRTAFCEGIHTSLAISARMYKSIVSAAFTKDENDCLLYRLNSRPGETYKTFAPGSPRVMLVPVMDGNAGGGTVNIKAFRAFFLESVDSTNSLAGGRFVRTIVSNADLDFTAPDLGVRIVKLVAPK